VKKPLLEPFQCKIQAYDPWLPDTYLEELDVIPVSLEKLLETSKFIFVLAVPSAENKEFITRQLMERIQENSVLILLSRAHVIDFNALIDLVNQSRFKAAIDVYPIEPLPKNHPVRNAKNVILTPHLAGSALQARRNIGHMVVADVEAIISGSSLRNLQIAQPDIVNRYE